LFRKFIVDFSEKYRSPGVQLTEDAQNMLRNYSWPGNVRQLKNVAEQIAVLEKERVIDAHTLQNYLPNESRTSLPTLVPSNKGAKEDFSERDLLYKVLFDMKKDMVDLKKLVVELIQKGVDATTFDQNSPYINQLYQEIEPQLKSDPENYGLAPTLTIHSPNNNPANVIKGSVAQDDYLQDAQEVEESLSLIDKESDL